MESKFTVGALLLALILMLTLACSGENPTPAPETERTQQELLRTIERMGEQIDSLQQEMEEPKETRDADEASASEEQTTPGICGRTPIVQEVILQTLRASSCRFVTNEELYRITEFRNLSGDYEGWGQFKAGDLDGLVNLKEMGIAGNFTLPAGTFKGAGISQLHFRSRRKLLFSYGIALSCSRLPHHLPLWLVPVSVPISVIFALHQSMLPL